MRVFEYCGFATLRDSLIRDRLILEVKNDRARIKLLESKDLTVDKALDILRTAELTEIRASEKCGKEGHFAKNVATAQSIKQKIAKSSVISPHPSQPM